jgi:hypothetical protein
MMLQEIGTVDRIPEYIKRAKDQNDPFRLMGLAIASLRAMTRGRESCRRPVTRS